MNAIWTFFRPGRLFFAVFTALLLLLPAAAVFSQPAQPQAETDWRREWGVESGFALDIDAPGFYLPSAIAFVPNPGPGPKDPLYFVLEVRGKVKVVSNDRTVTTFAENPYPFVPEKELPSGLGQGGTAGICLDPPSGYVFVTFLYEDNAGQLRNGMLRYETQPGTFAAAPTAQRILSPVFEADTSGLAHFVGSCVIHDGALFVGVGEAWQPHLAQELSSAVGKILRMSLEGEPLPDNPFYASDDPKDPRNYIWAVGLRNPWGLSFVGDRLFSADNGARIDRFIEVERGQNYFWNGRDESIATNADFVWVPAVGPTQMSYLGPDATVFPEGFRDRFFVGTTGNDVTAGGIVGLRYDWENERLAEPPAYFVRSLTGQTVTGIVFGPDGLYFAPMYPGPDGTTPILKVSYDPARGHPLGPNYTNNPSTLFFDRGCIGCHRLDGAGGFGGAAGPPLDRATLASRLSQRVNNDAYIRSLDVIDQLTSEPQASFRAARDAIRQAQGDERVRLWLKYRVLEPRFDNTTTPMPNVGLSEQEADVLAAYLLDGAGPSLGSSDMLASLNFFFRSRLRVGLAAFALGALVVGGAVGLFALVRRRKSR